MAKLCKVEKELLDGISIELLIGHINVIHIKHVDLSKSKISNLIQFTWEKLTHLAQLDKGHGRGS